LKNNLWLIGYRIIIALLGHASTQQLQNQHSSGYCATGGSPSFGFGMSVWVLQILTHSLQPVQSSGSINTAGVGVTGFGAINAFFIVVTIPFLRKFALPDKNFAQNPNISTFARSS